MFVSFSGFRLVRGCSADAPTGGLMGMSPPFARPGLRINARALWDYAENGKSQLHHIAQGTEDTAPPRLCAGAGAVS